MNDKQRESVKIVLQQCSEGHLDAEEALTIIDAIVGEPPQVQYVPYPSAPNPSIPLGPTITYGGGTGDPTIEDQFRILGEEGKQKQ